MAHVSYVFGGLEIVIMSSWRNGMRVAMVVATK